MIYKLMFFVLALNVLSSCGSGSSGPSYDLKGFQTESIGGGGTYARFADQENWPLSTGHVINGVRNGAWTTYHPQSNKPKTITNYINGQKNGDEITFNDRGNMESIIGYRNDKLHGLSTTFKSSRVVNETTYANGNIDGPFKVFDERSGKIQRSGTMKNGKPHGELLNYSPEGVVNMRYEYKDGVKVSGGIVEKPASE